MESDIVHDELNIRQNESMIKLLNFDTTEKVLYSAILTKINKRNVGQERLTIITTKAIYNILPNTGDLKYKMVELFSKVSKTLIIKRIIPLSKIQAITISSFYLSFEFVIHVKDEYDYRYDGKVQSKSGNIDDRRDKFLLAIAIGLTNYHQVNLTLLLTKEPILVDYTTQQKDLKEGVRRMSSLLVPIEVTPVDLATGIQYLIKKHNQKQKEKKPNPKFINQSTIDIHGWEATTGSRNIKNTVQMT